MPNNIKEQVSEENVKTLVRYYLQYLNKEGYKPLRGMPTIQAFHKKEDLIGLVLIDDNNNEIKYEFVNEPLLGIDNLFFTLDELQFPKMSRIY